MLKRTDPDVRVEIDSKGRKRILHRCSCAVCKSCWVYVDNRVCMYGGPYDGYQKVVTAKTE